MKEEKDSVLAIISGQDMVVCLSAGLWKSIIFKVIPWCHQFFYYCNKIYVILRNIQTTVAATVAGVNFDT